MRGFRALGVSGPILAQPRAFPKAELSPSRGVRDLSEPVAGLSLNRSAPVGDDGELPSFARAALPGEWFCWEAHPEALDEIGHAVGVHYQCESLTEFPKVFGPRMGDAAELDELGEEALEACRGDDLEDPAGRVASVPERMPLPARFMDEVPRARLEVLVTQDGAHTSLEHEAVLVLVVVAVQWRGERPGRHRMFDKREAVAGFGPVEHKAHSDAAKKASVPILRSDDSCCAYAHAPSFHWTSMSRRI